MKDFSLNLDVKSLLSASQIERLLKIARKVEPKILGEVEINVVADKRIKELNRLYRGQNKITDVLSFAWSESSCPSQQKMLGQLFICAPQINRQAKSLGENPKREFARMIAHGLLHLSGHDHLKPRQARKMFNLQEKIVKFFF